MIVCCSLLLLFVVVFLEYSTRLGVGVWGMASENEEEGEVSRWTRAARMSVEELEEAYGTNAEEGLTQEEAMVRLEENGLNEMSKKAKRASRPRDRESRQRMRESGPLLARQATVRRGGEWFSVRELDVVVGDVIRVQAGDVVGADVRIVSFPGSEVRVDRSTYTGDTYEYQASTGARVVPPHWDDHDFFDEASNLLLHGVMVLRGEAIGIVIATGKDTIINHVLERYGKSVSKCAIS